MREETVSLIKDIVEAVFKVLLCIFITALIVGVLVVQSPDDLMSYAVLSFVLFIDVLIISTIIPQRKRIKYKPRTIPKQLVFILSSTLYCLVLAVTVLTYSLFLVETVAGIVVVSVALFIFGGACLADLGALLYQMIGYIQIKQCLKYGEETTAEFLGEGNYYFYEHSGHYRSRHFKSTSGGSVVFKYKDYNGTELQVESKCVYLDEEIDMLKKMSTFKIKYNHRTAVIAETFEPTDEEQEPSEPQADGQAEPLSENEGDE